MTDKYSLLPSVAPVYPWCRPVHVLYWSTYNEGSHAAVATNRRSLDSMFDRLLKLEGTGLEIEACFTADAVMPPLWMDRQIRTKRWESRLRAFCSWVGDEAKTYQNKRRRPPPGLLPCPKYDDGYGSEDKYGFHTCCLTCDSSKYIIVGRTWEDYFIERGCPDVYAWKTKRGQCVRDGQRAREDAPLRIFTDEFGHHSKGLKMNEIAPGEYPGEKDPMLICQDVLVADSSPYLIALDKAARADKARTNEREALRDADRKRRERESWEKTRAFFEDGIAHERERFVTLLSRKP